MEWGETVDEVDVVIVGAGPVGLYLASDLARRGVVVQVIDRARRPLRHSRASVVWPRQLELLHAVGVADELLERGRAIEGVAFHSSRGELGQLRFSAVRDAPFSFGLAVSQEVTEQVLIHRYEALLGPLRRDGELVELAQDGAGVNVTVRTDDSKRGIRANWVVGADGAHSSVRELAGIAFNGPVGQARFGIGDARIDGTISTRLLHYFYSDSVAIGISPFTEETMRIAVSMPGDAPEPDRGFFRKVLTENTRLITDVGEPEWATAFDVRFRTAEQFIKGRVLLIGDAAHVMSPAGGQGMNTGLQDAANLGWKLAQVVHGAASESLLSSYDSERRWAAQQVSATSGRLARWSAARGPIESRKRDAEVFLATRSRRRPNLVEIVGQLDTRYPTARPVPRGSRIGTRFPSFSGQAPTRAPWSSWPAHDANGYTLFVWPGSTDPYKWASIVSSLAQQTTHVVRDLARTASPESALRLGRRAHYFLVRPDGHVAAEGRFAGPDDLPRSVLRGAEDDHATHHQV
jgi:2-polyprenyl-6-methoxyphenol hydroxylase-like FAD-dependent oxidoreductase